MKACEPIESIISIMRSVGRHYRTCLFFHNERKTRLINLYSLQLHMHHIWVYFFKKGESVKWKEKSYLRQLFLLYSYKLHKSKIKSQSAKCQPYHSVTLTVQMMRAGPEHVDRRREVSQWVTSSACEQ